jgi:N-ethylmaleimide reductase
MSTLFSPMDLKGHALPNRIAMAPLTRCRAGDGDVPQPISAVYYAQRASAGIVISEATNVTPKSCAFEKAPGIYSEAQVAGWKVITDAVHKAGGRIFMQLWHCGRVGSEAILNGEAPLSPSGVNDDLGALQVYGLMANGRYAQIAATPSRAMTLAEIEETIADYAKGAANAIKAECDGVEIHAANGYLPHQFLSATLNQRTDKYGGSLQGRLQFLKEVIEAILAKVDASKVGIRISPFAGYNNTRDPNAKETYTAVAKMVESYGLVYLHVADTNAWGGTPDMPEILKTVRPHYTGCLMGNGGIDPGDAQKMVEEGALDMVAFGRPFLSNPDLPARIKNGGPYNEARYVGWYGGSEEGYTDYPSL